MFKSGLLFVLTSTFALSFGLELPLPAAGNDVVGKIRYELSKRGESLADVGRRFDMGLVELIESNPHLRKKGALSAGTKVTIPSMFVLPKAPRRGIVINLSELRLYYYPPGSRTVITEPVGIGREGWQTPLGVTKIVQKKERPTWYPTKNVRDDALRLGVELPAFVPPGPDNPLGLYSMRLGWREYLIHGTNKPEGVGRRSSAGCIRMFPEDIETLFRRVPVGTTVRVVDEPFKVGWHGKQLVMEAHYPIQESRERYEVSMADVVNHIHKKSNRHKTRVYWRTAKEIAKDASGLPRRIGQRN